MSIENTERSDRRSEGYPCGGTAARNADNTSVCGPYSKKGDQIRSDQPDSRIVSCNIDGLPSLIFERENVE